MRGQWQSLPLRRHVRHGLRPSSILFRPFFHPFRIAVFVCDNFGATEVEKRNGISVEENLFRYEPVERISHAESPIKFCRRIVIRSDRAYRDCGVVWNA